MFNFSIAYWFISVVLSFYPQDLDSQSTSNLYLAVKHPVDDRKTISLASEDVAAADAMMHAVGSGGESAIGTSTAFEIDATPDERLTEVILNLIKGVLTNYWIIFFRGSTLFWKCGNLCILSLLSILIGLFLGAGGPRQYLHQTFPVAASRSAELASVLEKMVPKLDSEKYIENYPIPCCFPGALAPCLVCILTGNPFGIIELLLYIM